MDDPKILNNINCKIAADQRRYLWNSMPPKLRLYGIYVGHKANYSNDLIWRSYFGSHSQCVVFSLAREYSRFSPDRSSMESISLCDFNVSHDLFKQLV